MEFNDALPMKIETKPDSFVNRPPTWLLALVPVILWGGSFYVTKSIYADWGPITVAAGRWLMAAAFFAVLVAVRGEAGELTAALRAEPGTVLAFGVIGVALLYAVQNVALTYTTITNASVLGNLVPIFVLALSMLVLGERPRWRLVLAIVGATIGAALLSLEGGHSPWRPPICGGICSRSRRPWPAVSMWCWASASWTTIRPWW